MAAGRKIFTTEEGIQISWLADSGLSVLSLRCSMGVRVRASVVSAVFQKTLRLSPSRLPVGEVTTLISNDCTRLLDCTLRKCFFFFLCPLMRIDPLTSDFCVLQYLTTSGARPWS
jgi:hypothetical protein